MAIQTVTTGQLEKAQAIVIAETLFTMEHNAPIRNLVTMFKLGSGEKQVTVPKVGQMTANDLVDGVDITSSEAIGMTTTDLTTAEVGLKVILTDKLVRQEKPEMFRVVGRQMADGVMRKQDTDLIALFDGFSNTAGASGAGLNLRSFLAVSAMLKTQKAPRPWSMVHHPNAIYVLAKGITATPGTYPFPRGYSEDLLRDFWNFTVDKIPVFDDGNIAPGVASKGAMFARESIALLESTSPAVERERDASLRATELVMVTDYGVFELDDDYGVEMQYDSTAPSTSST